MKKFTAILLVVLMALAVIPFSTLAQSAIEAGTERAKLALLDNVWASLEAVENEAIEAGAEGAELVYAVYNAAINDPRVDAGSMGDVSARGFCFTVDGMLCAYNYVSRHVDHISSIDEDLMDSVTEATEKLVNTKNGPFSMNENGEKVSRKETSREQQVRGVFRIITDYMEALKAQGVYDSSMIVITADHGGVSLYQNPAVFVKPADAHRSQMAVNDAPLTFRNLRAAFMEEATGLRNEAYGDGMFTEPARGVLRTHTFDAVLYKNVYGETSEKEYGKARYLTFEFGDPARDDGQIVKPQQDRTE